MYATLGETERERDCTLEKQKNFPLGNSHRIDDIVTDGRATSPRCFESNFLWSFFLNQFLAASPNRIRASLLGAAVRVNTNATADWDRLTGFPRRSTREPKLSCYLPLSAPLNPISPMGPRGNRPGKFLRPWEWMCEERCRLVGDACYMREGARRLTIEMYSIWFHNRGVIYARHITK